MFELTVNLEKFTVSNGKYHCKFLSTAKLSHHNSERKKKFELPQIANLLFSTKWNSLAPNWHQEGQTLQNFRIQLLNHPVQFNNLKLHFHKHIKTWIVLVQNSNHGLIQIILTGPPCNQRIIGHGLVGFSTL